VAALRRLLAQGGQSSSRARGKRWKILEVVRLVQIEIGRGKGLQKVARSASLGEELPLRAEAHLLTKFLAHMEAMRERSPYIQPEPGYERLQVEVAATLLGRAVLWMRLAGVVQHRILGGRGLRCSRRREGDRPEAGRDVDSGIKIEGERALI